MTWRALIVEGDEHERRVNSRESVPKSLARIGDGDSVALDWTVKALKGFGIKNITYFGSYHIEKVISRFADLDFLYSDQSGNGINLNIFFEKPSDDDKILIISATSVLLPEAIEKMTKHNPAVGTDKDGKPAGVIAIDAKELLKLSGEAVSSILADLDVTLSYFPKAIKIDLLDCAASMLDQQGLAKLIFQGKAQTLDNLAHVVREAVFLPRVRVTLADWLLDGNKVIERIKSCFPDQSIVIRSSVKGEDGLNASHAGEYTSVLNVDASSSAELMDAFEEVISSYSLGRSPDKSDEILVQPQLKNFQASGVLLTRDPRLGAPYFLLNEDRVSGRSDTVTAGNAEHIKEEYILWTAKNSLKLSSVKRKLLNIAWQIMQLSRCDSLDIEYVIGKNSEIFILQARPLVAALQTKIVSDEDVQEAIKGTKYFLKSKLEKDPSLFGKTNLFGVMPDWNPAEMLGVSPRPLALSLYQKLIGESAWAIAREEIGYRGLKNVQLILSFSGRPYVDVRASFNSLLPATLDPINCERLVNYYIQTLKNDPSLHDKVEFEVAITCLSPDWEIVERRLNGSGVDTKFLKESLRELTQNILKTNLAFFDIQFSKLNLLVESVDHMQKHPTTCPHENIEQLKHLIENCQHQGLVPFSILARYAFIAMSFLKGFLAVGIISHKQYSDFLMAVPTVASKLRREFNEIKDREKLIKIYGHLRPNSYEITSLNYASDPSRFSRSSKNYNVAKKKMDPLSVLRSSFSEIESSLTKLGLDISVEELITFMTSAISGREEAKFFFMKAVNLILTKIEFFGEKAGLKKETLSYLRLEDLLSMSDQSWVDADFEQLKRRARFNKKKLQVTMALNTPHLITSLEDLSLFVKEGWRPNFITQDCVQGNAIWLDNDSDGDVEMKIVLISAADPGFDWIFSLRIKGLITEYGGAASHMAIRAAEFGLPAAIGVGSNVFQSLVKAKEIKLDASSEKITVLS
jgi:phosphohistidine swiveling domain-containing protein